MCSIVPKHLWNQLIDRLDLPALNGRYHMVSFDVDSEVDEKALERGLVLRRKQEKTKSVITQALQGKRYVVLAGPIGVGKSTLTREIGAMPGFVPLYEEPDKNPYLPDYYAGQAVSFEMQQYFLSQFWEGAGLVRRWLQHGHRVIQDRSVYEMLEIFSRYQNQQGQMSDRQYDIQRRLCESSFDWMPRPDLIIYLDASTGTLLERIGQRSREYEQAITPGFIDQIRVLYTEWIAQLVAQGAYIEGSSVTPVAGPWSGTRILKIEDWG